MKFLIFSFLPSPKKAKISFLKNQSLKMIDANPVIGLDVGIPLNILQNVFTSLHYGFDITTFKIVLLQFMIGYYTYGYDRFLDSNSNESLNDKKKESYKYLIKYSEIYKITYPLTFILISTILLLDENSYINLPFVFLILTSNYYKDFKTQFPLLKPFYISTMWTLSAVILPCVLYDNDFSILKYPLDYLPCFLNILASSNLADVKDIDEDKKNGINTIPITYGKDFTIYFSLICLFLSSLIFGLNHNFLLRPIFNSLFEIQNVGLSFIPFILNNSTKII